MLESAINNVMNKYFSLEVYYIYLLCIWSYNGY